MAMEACEKKSPAGASGAQAGATRSAGAVHPHYTPESAPRQAVYELARFLSGASDADLNLIRQAWPDIPISGNGNGRGAVIGWLEKERPDLVKAVAACDPSAPPPSLGSGQAGEEEPHPDIRGELQLDIGTDAWLGRRAAELLSDQIAYVPQWGWMTWDGKKWVRDAGMQRTRVLALQALTRDIARMISNAAGDEEEVKKLSKILFSIQRRTPLDNALTFAESWMLTEPDRFDQHPYLLNTPSGVVNLRNGEVLPHQPDLYLTQITRVPYDPEATAPRFLRFLEEIFGGNERLISFVHRLLGYGLLGHNQERIFAIFWGKGKNGKSTLCRILEGVLGDYLKEARPESLESLRAGEIRPRNDLAVLRGARLVTFNESREGAKFDPALIKQIAGGTDLITVRYLYREDFSYRPAFLPILRTNHKPHFPGGDPALWDRIRLVPFTVEIPPERQEKDLAERILAEEGPGVLAWLVQGCITYQREGLGEPPEVQEATRDYRMETDPVWAFVCECCEQDSQAREETSKLYAAFTTWWSESGQGGEPISSSWFGRVLTNFGFAVDRTKNRRFRLGLRLRG